MKSADTEWHIAMSDECGVMTDECEELDTEEWVPNDGVGVYP